MRPLSTPLRIGLALGALLSVLLLGTPPVARAQIADAVDPESEVGYELALHGVAAAERGGAIELRGTALEVHGLAELRPTAGLDVEVALTSAVRDGRGRERVTEARARSTEDGRFTISIAMPARDLASPTLEIVLRRPGRPGRTFLFPAAQLPSRFVALLTDRNRYQPGETIRAWALLRATRDRAPIGDAPLVLTLADERGQTIAERRISTARSGALTAEIAIPESAGAGTWTVRARGEDPGTIEAARTIQVVRRTVERLAVAIHLERELYEPGVPLRGRVDVTTPSGTPVRGARVLVTVGDERAPPLELVTDDGGHAAIDARTPSFLAGEVATMQVVARATHAAYGTLVASAPYTLARTRWLVEATPEAGGLVPEVGSEIFLRVADPRGRPIAAGTEIEVRGVGLAGGRAVATTDAHGVAVVTVRLPRGGAARAQGGRCAGTVAASFEVEVRGRPLVVAPVCARVAADAQVLARVRAPVVAPGGVLDVELARRPAARARAVIVELLDGERAIASSVVAPSAQRASVAIPQAALGVLRVRARTIAPDDATRPIDQEGATHVEPGSIAAVLVRPVDAFALSVTPDRELHRVRERAGVVVRASVAPERGWVALLARDEAAHGGETDFALHWIEGELREVLESPLDPAHHRFLRAAVASGLPVDGGVYEPPPLVREPWESHRAPIGGPTTSGGVLRDPIAMREELRRRGLAPAMRAIERAVDQLGDSASAARREVSRTVGTRVELHPDAIEHLVRAGMLAPSEARTLGGQPLTVAMIEDVDPSFTFDRIAHRVARRRLVRLLVALARFADPDTEAALRASAGEPPERWLARVVQLGMVPAEALVDPWGRPYALHRVAAGRAPAIVISARAAAFELASAGPDGRLGTADDVRDPFARAVPERTPYAVVSGEDELMRQLSALAPGERVLAAMASAYDRLGLAAEEERRASVVTASTSEAEMPADEPMAAAEAMYDEGGYGRGGEAAGGAGLAPGAPPPPPMQAARRSEAFADVDADGILDVEDRLDEESARDQQDQRGPTGLAGELVRQEFPATLFFVGEVALDGAGVAEITVPLADALTTYRLEAIGWSASGWIASGRGAVRVDQEAMVDAPVPPVVRVGDVVRLPVRLQNRTREPLRARFEASLEPAAAGAAAPSIELAAIEPGTVPPGEAIETILELRPRSEGEGALVVRALREDGSALDAVRRPLRAIADARRVIERREALVRDGDAIALEIPARATPRGPGEVRVAAGGAIVGDPAAWGLESDRLAAAWALAMAERPMPDAIREALMATFRVDPRDDSGAFRYLDALTLATSIGAAWHLDALDEHGASAALRALSESTPDPERVPAGVLPSLPAPPSALLVAIAPALLAERSHPALREDLLRVIERLRALTSAEGAQATDAPATWARVAAGLELTRRGAPDPRAEEMLRRVERHVFAIEGDDGSREAWLEPDVDDGRVEPRIEPTALLALARIAAGDPERALPLVRSIATVARGAPRWPAQARALASAAAARLASGGPIESIALSLDGASIDVALEGGIATASLPRALAPGAHSVVVSLPRGAIAIATVELRYALPWDVRAAREAPIELAWQGELGARDVRAGLALTIRNRGARVLARPVVEVELPAGAELDEPTREALGALLAAPPELEGGTLRLALRPMAPAGSARIPLRARWSVGGALRGLGASAWDDASPAAAAVRPVSVLASRTVELADRGAEPEAPEPESTPPPEPPPPLPVLRPLSEVSR